MSIDEPDVIGSSRLEVRWILPGLLPAPVIEWFERFPTTHEKREDNYLVIPKLPGLAVKLRGGLALDVKAYDGSPGILDISGSIQGRLEAWRKWSFPLSARSEHPADSLIWRHVGKRRQLCAFLPDDDQVVPGFPAVSLDRLMCTVELSEVVVHDEHWWTFAFESAGPPDRLQEAIETTAARFLSAGILGTIPLTLKNSGPYSDWLEAF